MLATTIPNCVAYDPCYGYELVVILRDGMRRMLEQQEDIFYYVTVMNENYEHPAMASGVDQQILKGMYRLRPSTAKKGKPEVQLLGSGTILREVLAAAALLESDWSIGANVWSVTSFTELRREGIATERWNRFNPDQARKLCHVEQSLAQTTGPVIAATDYMRTLPDLIRTWVPRRYVTLGTDGFGRSDTRAALRRFFEVDRHHVVIAALNALADDGTVKRELVREAMTKYGVAPDAANPWDR